MSAFHQPLFSFVINSSGSLLQCSTALATWLGYSTTELSSKTFEQIVASHEQTGHRKGIELFTKASEQLLSCIFLHKGGERLKADVQLLYVAQTEMYCCNVQPVVPVPASAVGLSPGVEMEKILQYTDESFLVVNRRLEIVLFNNKFQQVYQQFLGKEIKVGEDILSYAYTRDVEAVKDIYARAFNGEEIITELEVPQGDNVEAAYFVLRYKPMWASAGIVDSIFVTIDDITRQKQSEQLLSISEKRYKALVEHGLDAVVILTEEGKPLYVSPAVEKILGYNKEECATLDLFSLTHPDDIPKVTNVWEKVMQNPGVPMQGPASRILHKDGTWRWLQDTITNMLHEPYINGIVDNFKDVTEKIDAEQLLLQKQQQLEQAEANYREIFEKANEGILIYNIQTGLLTEVNRKACEMLGCTQKEILSSSRKQYESDIPGYGVSGAMEKFKKAVQGETQLFEWPVKRNDGIDTWLELSLTRANIAGTDRILAFFRVIDERKKAEVEKEAERKEKEALMNSTGEFIWSINTEFKLLAANEPFLDSVRQRTGYTLKPGDSVLVAKSYTDHYLKLWTRLYTHAFEGHRFTEEVYMPAMNDNPERWVEISFNPVSVEDQVQYLTCFGRDITENKLYEQQLKFTNDKLNVAQQIAKLGVWELDLRTQEFTCSPETYLIFGVQETDFSANLEGFVNMIHPEDRGMFSTEFKYALEGEKLLNIEYRIITPTGLVKTVVLRGSLFYDGAHQPTRFNGTVQDMTERKYLKEQLVASQRQLELIYNSVNDIIFLTSVEPDEQFRFESVNQAFLSALHLEKHDVINKYMDDLLPPNQVPVVLKYYRQALQSGKPVSWQATSPVSDKSGIITISPVADDAGKFTQIIGSVHDITEIKRSGEKLASLNDQLKIQAKAMAASNLELERFAYVASHDLQEPLRMISSFLKLLEKKYQGQLDETGNKYIHYAVDGSERMKKLIMDLLAYSKVSTNDDELTSTNMNTVVAEVVHILQNKIEELGATLDVAALPTLHNTRRTQMFQLMQNLIGNALKYHGKAATVISVTARELPDQWEFAIKDNGVGFEQKFAESVFIMFQRLHHRSEFSGTGIGLSICKKIVEMHHGQIWVESAPGQGSTFYFTVAK